MLGRSQLAEGSQSLPFCDHLLLCFLILLVNSHFHFCISQFSSLMPCALSKMESYPAAPDHGQTPSIYCCHHPLCQRDAPCYLFQIIWTPSPTPKSTHFFSVPLREGAVTPLSPCSFSTSTVLSGYCSLDCLDANRSNFSYPITRSPNILRGQEREAEKNDSLNKYFILLTKNGETDLSCQTLRAIAHLITWPNFLGLDFKMQICTSANWVRKGVACRPIYYFSAS